MVSRNSFNRSNQRCVSIAGTSNVTIAHNIGYKPLGHCIYIGYQSKDNIILGNLVSENRQTWIALPHESDRWPAAFINMYSPNYFTHNIAVAGNQ